MSLNEAFAIRVRGLAILATLCSGSMAAAQPASIDLALGGGAGERGPLISGGADLHYGPVLAALRGEYGFGWHGELEAPHEAGFEATVLGGFRVRGGEGPLWALAGARLGDGGFSDDRRLHGALAVRWRVGEHLESIEGALTHLIGERDRPHLRHAEAAPGWYLRVRVRYYAVGGIEVGATGLGYRDSMGEFRPEVYGRLTLEFPLALGGVR